MHKTKRRTAPSSFLEKSEQPCHSYTTPFSSGNYVKPQTKLRKCRFQISIEVRQYGATLSEVRKFNRLLFLKLK